MCDKRPHTRTLLVHLRHRLSTGSVRITFPLVSSQRLLASYKSTLGSTVYPSIFINRQGSLVTWVQAVPQETLGSRDVS